MKVHVVPNSPGGIASFSEQKVIQVTDLTADPAYRPLWRSRRSSDTEAAKPYGLPGLGYSSPMGYWLSDASGALAPGAPAGPTIQFVPPGEEAAGIPAGLALAADGTSSRPVQTVRVKSPNSGEGDVMLTLGAGGARVAATPAAWKTLAEPILLAVCQYWRFCAIDAELARLTERARGDLGHATMPGPSSLKASRRLTGDAQAARTLLLDLPHFEGPLTDPFPYCSSERSAQAYATLSEKLHLEEWCDLIDEKAEAVEDSYEAMTEKLFEYKNFAWEVVLESVIVVILLAELGLTIWEAFSP